MSQMIRNVRGVHHVGITVSDLDRSEAFYNRLGFESTRRLSVSGADTAEGTGVPDARLDVGVLSGHGTLLELIEYRPRGHSRPPRNNDVGAAHLCLQVRDIDAVFDELAAAGVGSHSRPHRDDDEGLAWVYVTDPDGATVELVEFFDDPRRPPAERA